MMSVVVQQTIPFSIDILSLQDPSRWNTLLPLLRPSVAHLTTAKAQTVLLDRSHTREQRVPIAVIGRHGNFSSKLLDDRHVSAIITERDDARGLSSTAIHETLTDAGLQKLTGLVIVRLASQRQINTDDPDIVEIEVANELEFDHVLHILGQVSAPYQTSIKKLREVIEIFVTQANTTHSRFADEKAGSSPAVVHEDGPKAYQSARDAIGRDMRQVIDKQTSRADSTVLSVHYSDINGLSRLENYILAAELGRLLDDAGLAYDLSHSTILDHGQLARGFAISTCPFPSEFVNCQDKALQHHQVVDSKSSASTAAAFRASSSMKFSDAEIRGIIVRGCNAVIEAEPTITEYDIIVGDGDCGYTLKDGARQVLTFVEGRDLSNLPAVVNELVSDLEVNMGGTSGALYCIYLTALASSLSTEQTIPQALDKALHELMKYTKARVGDRTMMDALIPFVSTLNSTQGGPIQAVQAARDGVEGTKRMEAKLGRSSYLDESTTQGVPDPGAYGLLVLLEAMARDSS